MQLPFFYAPGLGSDALLSMDEETARHITQVLRMKEGEVVGITNGKGAFAECKIVSASKKSCALQPGEITQHPAPKKQITMAIGLLKNKSRMEWFFEKGTEIGVSRFVPLLTERTERQQFRLDRATSILISAMLQSQQYRLPEICAPLNFQTFIQQKVIGKALIAHCEPDDEKQYLHHFQNSNEITILIGPEGDFTSAEIQLAKQHGYQAITLGATRLRTETAGIVAAAWLCV